jgi:hypothetical protein
MTSFSMNGEASRKFYPIAAQRTVRPPLPDGRKALEFLWK